MTIRFPLQRPYGRLVWLPLLLAAASPLQAQTQVQLSCTGTVLEARGNAELKRDTQSLRVSLGLEAEAATADGALEALQRRLAAVRQRLQALQVRDLRVTSPSTWQRKSAVVASLQVSGELAPPRLQAFIREVGALPGVRLNPVATEADPAADPAVRARLLRAAYQDALAQGRQLAAAIGLASLQPLEVRVEGMELRPMALRAGAAPPFDPAELPQPSDRLRLQVRFCAR